jgi:hypothetical protein
MLFAKVPGELLTQDSISESDNPAPPTASTSLLNEGAEPLNDRVQPLEIIGPWNHETCVNPLKFDVGFQLASHNNICSPVELEIVVVTDVLTLVEMDVDTEVDRDVDLVDVVDVEVVVLVDVVNVEVVILVDVVDVEVVVFVVVEVVAMVLHA